MKPTTMMVLTTLLVAACNSSSSVKENENKEPATSNTTTATTDSKKVADNGEDGWVSFKVNDTLVRTNKTTGGDNDEHIGVYTQSTDHLSLSLMGDVPDRPHRGWLRFSLTGFKFEPASYTLSKDHYVSFTRYETINAGGGVEYNASVNKLDKGTDMNLTITKIEPDPNSFTGRDWLASGTFSAKMLIREFSPVKRSSYDSVTITEGKFERVRIAGGPKHN
jgi:hypothetical protein